MKVLIFGASGSTGQYLVKQALASGHRVTVLSAIPPKLRLPMPT
jgi:uncharacterized protein YbjT (DUF2867 family)